jgi:hypothetical protein
MKEWLKAVTVSLFETKMRAFLGMEDQWSPVRSSGGNQVKKLK